MGQKTPYLAEIYTYPVKSLKGIRHNAVSIDQLGPIGDRRYMLVDTKGHFVSQRRFAQMVLISAEETESGLCLSIGERRVEVRQPALNKAVETPVTVWNDSFDAIDCGDEVANWLSKILKQSFRLVYRSEDTRRLIDPNYVNDERQLGFADGFPFLLLSQASLQALNSRMTKSVSVRRFRPNLVIAGCESFAEDSWKTIKIGESVFDVAKPCSRCVVPSIDPDTAKKDNEIIRVLTAFRRREDKLTYFGQNLIHHAPGRVGVGDAVEIID